jgi:HEAT repeat protein
MYCSTESDEEEKIIFDLLIRIGSKTFLEVRRRLKDTSTPFAKRLVKILCHAQGEDVVQDLKRLKKHKDPGVQEAILEGLIKFKDPEGTAILRKLLQVKKNAVRRSAIALAGMHRVQDVTDDLVSIIRKIPLLKAHFVTNETIITALGRIGDSRAIPILERLAKSRWVLNQKRFNHMREILYDSLSGYPYESILKLVKMGKNASSTAIRKTCMEIEARNVA